MIARIGLSPAALRDVSRSDSLPEFTALHDAVTRSIWAHGALVIGSDIEGRELVDAVKEISQRRSAVGSLWSTVLAELEKNRRVIRSSPPLSHPLGAVSTLDELRAEWAGRADVTLLPTGQAKRLGTDDTGLLFDATSALEVAAAPAATYCKTISALRELATKGLLDGGAPRELFWERVLKPLARLSSQVTVMDQFLFSGVRWHHEQRARSGRWAPDVVIWLLRLLDEWSPPGTEVHLIGTNGSRAVPGTADEIASMLRDQWRPSSTGRLAMVEVVTGPWVQEDRLPHDRHVRFNVGMGIKVHPGFDRLARTTVQDRDGMAWQYVWEARAVQNLRAQEERVSRGQQTNGAIVVSRESA